ncbi:unnamed protein product [Penicillium manginii]
MESDEMKLEKASIEAERQPGQMESLVGQVQLKGLDLHAEGGRKMSYLQTISASWVICDSWAGLAGTVALAISQGGPLNSPVSTPPLEGNITGLLYWHRNGSTNLW